jgi:hypothetical protein
MEISKILSNSKITEVDTTTKQISTSYNESSVKDDINLVNIFAKITPLETELTHAIHSLKAESTLEDKDLVRDEVARGIYYMCTGFLHHPTKAIKEAAQAVVATFSNYGLEMLNESYAVESSLINSFLEDLSGDDIKVLIAKLTGVAQLIEDLKVAQADFEEASLEYSEGKAEDSTHRSATKIKKELLPIINDELVLYLKTMVMINSEQYSEFGGTVATIINDNNIGVKKRRISENSGGNNEA